MAPSGTYLAPVRNGVIQFPPPLKQWCLDAGWTLFRILVDDQDRLTLEPVGADNPIDPIEDEAYESSFDPEGRLWIPAELRSYVGLNDQSVMIRVEEGVIHIFLRKIFKNLGFGPERG